MVAQKRLVLPIIGTRINKEAVPPLGGSRGPVCHYLLKCKTLILGLCGALSPYVPSRSAHTCLGPRMFPPALLVGIKKQNEIEQTWQERKQLRCVSVKEPH